MSYDLFLLPPRGTLLPLGERQQILADFRQETNLDGLCEITDFLRETAADAHEARTLEECFRDGELERSEYENFCLENQLTATRGSPAAYQAARRFLDFKWGQNLFAPSLPPAGMVDDVRRAYRLIVEFARRHKLLVHDPQMGRDIDLENPGEFPPMWGPAPN